MKAYHQTVQPDPVPQVLQVQHRGLLYRWMLLHGNLRNHLEARSEVRSPPGHTHEDVYHILLFVEGDTDCILEGRRQAVRPGLLVLSAPGDRHHFSPLAPGVISFVQITFTWRNAKGEGLSLPFHDLLGQWAGAVLPDRGVLVQLDDAQTLRLKALIAVVLNVVRTQGELAQVLVRQVVTEIFVFLLREIYLPQREPVHPHVDARIVRAREYIDTHFRERLRVEELARRASLSPGYFMRAFKRAHGLSPIAYQAEQRLEAAREMLRLTSLSCSEISEELGYGDVYHFSKSFKKGQGLSPLAYRKEASPV